MKHHTWYLLLAALVLAGTMTLFLWPSTTTYEAVAAKPELSHAQTVWKFALEWCESHGNVKAINPNDRDNTPSYYSWQWKPTTFLYFGTRYGIFAKDTTLASSTAVMNDYATETAVIEAMILDAKHINWHQQFPDCVKRLGYPPSGA